MRRGRLKGNCGILETRVCPQKEITMRVWREGWSIAPQAQLVHLPQGDSSKLYTLTKAMLPSP